MLCVGQVVCIHKQPFLLRRYKHRIQCIFVLSTLYRLLGDANSCPGNEDFSAIQLFSQYAHKYQSPQIGPFVLCLSTLSPEILVHIVDNTFGAAIHPLPSSRHRQRTRLQKLQSGGKLAATHEEKLILRAERLLPSNT